MDLDDLLNRVLQLPPEAQKQLTEIHEKTRKAMKWIPNPGPQTDAYFSEADVLLYGGEPGGGKSQLILGLAFNQHKQSLIMRREYGDLDGLIADALKIHGSRDGFNGSPPPKLKVDDKRTLHFAAAHRVGDEQGQMGKGRDLLGIDEATHFAESQIRFLMGWNRTDDPSQRCRTVLATNPPLRPEGLWVNKMFAPWLDPTYPRPAKPGELRWVISDEDGNDKWVDGPGEYEVRVAGNLKKVRATSRTYIPASVKDNPEYMASGYQAKLDGMPEPYRSILLGGFKTTFKDQDNQCIPTAWIKAAQERWKDRPRPGVPMCAIGVDASGGGVDPMVLAPRYDGWFSPLIVVAGKDLPIETMGTTSTGIIISHRRDKAIIVIDMGGGYGGSIYEHCKANEIECVAHKGAESSAKRTKDKLLGFTNKRTELHWKFREALDPSQEGGSPISLPPDQELLAELAAPTFELTPNGIKLEPKDDVVERIGRSTNKADAVVMSWSAGPSYITDGRKWDDKSMRKGQMPRVISGRQNRRR